MNNTLVKGLQLLEALAGRDSPVGVSQLAAELGMGKSNVHRTLQALVATGYVAKDEARGAYFASLKIWEIGARVMAQLEVRRAASPAMQWLLEQTRETVHLSVLDGEQVVYIDKLDSPEPVRAYSEIGGRAPAYCVATGKAMLAWRDVEKPFAGHAPNDPPGFSPATITDRAELRREMERIRAQGYAVNRGEWRASVWGVAAPIKDGGGRVVAAIGLSGPASRIKPARVKPLAAIVMEAALRISSALTSGASSQG